MNSSELTQIPSFFLIKHNYNQNGVKQARYLQQIDPLVFISEHDCLIRTQYQISVDRRFERCNLRPVDGSLSLSLSLSLSIHSIFG